MRRNTRTPSHTHPAAHTGTHTTGSVSTHRADNEQSVSHTKDTHTAAKGKWIEKCENGARLPKAGSKDWDNFIKAWRKWYDPAVYSPAFEYGKAHIISQGYHVWCHPEQAGKVAINAFDGKIENGTGVANYEYIMHGSSVTATS